MGLDVTRQAQGPRERVESSSLTSVGYDATSGTLEIEFRSGRTYRYFQVPCSIHEALMAAPSKGRFFAAQVRNRFSYLELRPPLASPEAMNGPCLPLQG